MRNARRRQKRAQTGSSPCGFRAPAPAIYCAFSGRSRAPEKLRNRRFCAARLLFLRGTTKLPKHSGRQIQQNGAPPRAGGTFCGNFKAGAFWQKRIPPELRRKIFRDFPVTSRGLCLSTCSNARGPPSRRNPRRASRAPRRSRASRLRKSPSTPRRRRALRPRRCRRLKSCRTL